MKRTVCWSFGSLVHGQKLIIVTDPHIIETLLTPVANPDDSGNYGPYVDAALTAADADDAPGFYRGDAQHVGKERVKPFTHTVITVQIDFSRKYTLTKEDFAKCRAPLDAHYENYPWMKPQNAVRGQNAMTALLTETFGDSADAEAFMKDIGTEGVASSVTPIPEFLGLAFPEDAFTAHLLSAAYRSALDIAWYEAQLQLKAARSRL